jgi:Type II CAAX prenyl endopeptidase Rce1-like
MTGSQARNWEALAEVVTVFAFILLDIWWLHWHHPWLALVVLACIVASHIVRGERAHWLGFGWSGFSTAFPVVMPWVGAAALMLLGAGAQLGSIRHIPLREGAWGLAGYVLWGLFQQYVLNGFFVNRLAEFAGGPDSRLLPLSTALLFSLTHLPNWFLMAVTFVGGYLSVEIYRRYRSLYVLGLAHGLLGFLLYLTLPDALTHHLYVGPRSM